jgi:hypothetical protein
LTALNTAVYIHVNRLDSNIPLKNVTSNATKFLRSQPTLHVRALAFLLLLLVTYGATVEASHTHGKLVSINRTDNARSIAVESNSNQTAKDGRTGGACLICQFQQQLSISLFGYQPRILAPTVRQTRMAAAIISNFTQPNAPSRGRAPPLTS